MKESVEKAIQLLAEKVTSDTTSIQALQYTQAALNLAHVLLSIKENGERS